MIICTNMKVNTSSPIYILVQEVELLTNQLPALLKQKCYGSTKCTVMVCPIFGPFQPKQNVLPRLEHFQMI